MLREFFKAFYKRKENNIMATGFLKFDHDHTVYIDLDLATDEVKKAVIIDADDVETPICGGGSGDFSTATLTITNSAADSKMVVFPNIVEDDGGIASGSASIPANETKIVTIVLYKGTGYISVRVGQIVGCQGDVTADDIDGAIVTGDGSFNIIEGIS